MKHKITKVQNYLLVVDDALDINENDWTLKDQDIRRVSYLGQDNGNRIIAHLPLNGESPLEDVDLLPPIEEDIYQLAEQLSKEYSVYETAQDDVYQGILVGYRKVHRRGSEESNILCSLSPNRRWDNYPNEGLNSQKSYSAGISARSTRRV